MSRAKTTRVARSLRRRQKRLARAIRAQEQGVAGALAMMQAATEIARIAKDVGLASAVTTMTERFRIGMGLAMPTSSLPGPEAGVFTFAEPPAVAPGDLARIISQCEAASGREPKR